MSLLKYAIAAAIGYYAGQPSGRRQVQQLSQKATELVRSPKAAELKDRGSKLVGDRASAVVGKVARLVAQKLLDGMAGDPRQFLAPDIRDFFYVTAR